MAVRLASREELLSITHRALHALAADLAAADMAAPMICGVLVDEDGLEILLDRPAHRLRPGRSRAKGSAGGSTLPRLPPGSATARSLCPRWWRSAGYLTPPPR